MARKCPQCNSENSETARFCSNCAAPLPGIDEAVHTKTIETPIDELTTGSTFAGRYQIIEELGKGGMGRVYKVHDKETTEKIALKLIKSEIASDKKTIERFRNELITARKIIQKNVCRMYDLNRDKDNYYITMEYIEGQDLKGLIRQTGQLTIGKAVSIVKQICEGLSEAHNLGVIHRDLKPSNIMIDKEGNAKIMDFGIARSLKAKGITGDGIMIGTPEYMSPEQVEAKDVDERSDIYSLGIIMYEMLTGKLPFEAETPFAVGVKQKSEIPKTPNELNPQITQDLNELILKCLEKEKEKRYQSGSALFSELSKIEKGIPASSSSLPMGEPKTVKIGEVKWRNLIIFGGAVIFLIVLFIGRNLFFPERRDVIDSIAVLPLQNLSGVPEQEYFVDGVTDELIGQLGQISGLQRVISRTSVMRYKNTDKSLPEIARELNVDALVEGTVYQVGENVSIKLQLFDALPEERSLWTRRYDRPITDVLVMYGEMASAIAENIQVKLTAQEETRFIDARQVNPEAYEAYVRGSYKWMNYMTPEDLDTAEKHFNLALEKDPSYAPAYSGLAWVWIVRNQLGYSPPWEAGPRVKAAAQRAIELDANYAGAHEALALARQAIDWDWDGAWESWRRSLELNPNLASTQGGYGQFLIMIGHGEEALIHSERAIGLDPFNTLLHLWYAVALYSQRHYDEAIAAAREALRIQSDFPLAMGILWSVYEKKGMEREAFEAAKFYARGYNDPRIEAELDEGYAQGGYAEAMRRGAEALIANFPETFCTPSEPAIFYVAAGEKTKALDWLEKGLEVHDPSLQYILQPEYVDLLGDEPRYQELLRKIGLPVDKKE